MPGSYPFLLLGMTWRAFRHPERCLFWLAAPDCFGVGSGEVASLVDVAACPVATLSSSRAWMLDFCSCPVSAVMLDSRPGLLSGWLPDLSFGVGSSVCSWWVLLLPRGRDFFSFSVPGRSCSHVFCPVSHTRGNPECVLLESLLLFPVVSVVC